MTDERKPVSKRLRYEVLRRDGFTCRYCGGKAPDVDLTVDHVVPVTLGGTNDSTNLVVACKDCNAGKSSTSADSEIVEGVTEDAIRWAAAMQRAAAIQEARDADERVVIIEVDAAWRGWHLTDNPEELVPRPEGWMDSIRNFFRAGLETETMCELVLVAMRKETTRAWLSHERWRYFCGCCWRTIEERQEIAQAIIAADEDFSA